jgi:hypothetical protein
VLSLLRRKLDHIRYHSAQRPGNWWSRAIDLAFIASFLLSLPAALLADLAHGRERVAMDLPGLLARSPERGVEAWLMNPQAGGTPRSASGGGAGESDEILGNFNLSVTDRLRGWPLVTTIERQPARLNIDIIAERAARNDVARDEHDPVQEAIERALREDGRDEALAAWNMNGADTRRQWWAWLPAAGAWWLMMFFGAAFVIQFLRFGSLWMTGKRLQREAVRRAQGKCIACGYDMTGLEFNERCPECGARVW